MMSEVREASKIRATDMYSTHVLSDIGARSVYLDGKRTGYVINLKTCYYRGLPLSCIDFIELEVDGEPVRPEDMTVFCGGKEYAYLDLFKDDMETETYWPFGSLLRVVVKKDGGIPQGRHQVKVHLGVRCSYTPTREATCEKQLTFA
jgi:hypothetical protein